MRYKMSRLQRAKQFMPFSALKGFEERIATMSQERIERKVLSEDQIDELNYTLQQIEEGTCVCLTVFTHGHYEEIRGVVQRLLPDERRMVVNGRSIPMASIVALRCL